MPYEQIIAEASAQPTAAASTTSNATLAYAQETDMMGNDTGMMGNDTGMMMNATLAFAQEGAITPEGTVNDTMSMGNDTSMMMNATLAYAQEQVSIAAGSSNPSASEFYVPAEISVSAGSTVTWTNDDSTIHTVVEGGPQGGGAGATPAFDSSIIAPGATWENTFDTAGEFDYYCNLHPFMTGKVTVT
jgi:plastocyanin